MLVHSMLRRSAVNGPGERAVIWLQGCDLGCRGCWNPTSHAFDPAVTGLRKKLETGFFLVLASKA